MSLKDFHFGHMLARGTWRGALKVVRWGGCRREMAKQSDLRSEFSQLSVEERKVFLEVGRLSCGGRCWYVDGGR